MAGLSKYRSEYHDDWAWSLAIRGATNADIAEAFGVSTRTFIRWKNDNKSLDEAVTHGKEIADTKVEKSLYKRAMGMEITESERIVNVDKDGNPMPARVKTVTKQIPPDTMAIMYWLNNRQRAYWSQRQEVAVSADEDTPRVMICLPDNGRDQREK